MASTIFYPLTILVPINDYGVRPSTPTLTTAVPTKKHLLLFNEKQFKRPKRQYVRMPTSEEHDEIKKRRIIEQKDLQIDELINLLMEESIKKDISYAELFARVRGAIYRNPE